MNLYLGIAGAIIIIALFFITDPLNLFNKTNEKEEPKKSATIYDFDKKLKDKTKS